MIFTVLNWNIGGAKVLEQRTRAERDETRRKINVALRTILSDREVGPQPHVVTLQEIVQWREPPSTDVTDVLDPIPGYSYFPFKLIDSEILSSYLISGFWPACGPPSSDPRFRTCTFRASLP